MAAFGSLKEVGEKIEELVGQSIAELPQPNHFAWWHPEKNNGEGKTPGGYITFKRGDAHPWMPNLVVTAMFRDADEIRVYTLPGAQMPEGQNGLRVYYLSKKDSGSYEVWDLPVDAFVQMVADEWSLVAEVVRTAERERNQIVAYLESEGEMPGAEAALAIAQNQHWEEPPEPKAPEPPPNGAPQPASPSDPLPS